MKYLQIVGCVASSVDVEVILYWKFSSVNLSLITACTNVFYAKSEGVKDFFGILFVEVVVWDEKEK